MARITSDLFEVTEFAHHCPEEFFIAVIKIVIPFIILMGASPALTLIIFAMLPLMIACTRFFNKRMRAVYRESRHQVGEINAQVEDSLLGIRVSRALPTSRSKWKSFITATTSLCASTDVNTSIWPASTPPRACSTG